MWYLYEEDGCKTNKVKHSASNLLENVRKEWITDSMMLPGEIDY